MVAESCIVDAVVAIIIIGAITYADMRGHSYVPVIAAIILFAIEINQ